MIGLVFTIISFVMPKQGANVVMQYVGLATQWMVMLLLAVWLGHKVDSYFHWKIPVAMIVFPLVALVISLWRIISVFNQKK